MGQTRVRFEHINKVTHASYEICASMHPMDNDIMCCQQIHEVLIHYPAIAGKRIRRQTLW